jgi:hypothetical protein
MSGSLPRIVLAALAATMVFWGLGLTVAWGFIDRPCPPNHRELPVGLIDGVWRCMPIGVAPPAGDDAWWNSLPLGYRDHHAGLYLAAVQLRIFDYRNGTMLFIGFPVPPPYL